MSVDGSAGVDVFEVFKVGTLEPGQFCSLSLDEAKRLYTELVPIRSLDQLRSSVALARVPSEDHVVVDRRKLKQMLLVNADSISAKRTDCSIRHMEEKIEGAKRAMAQEVVSTLEFIVGTFETGDRDIKEKIDRAWHSTKSGQEDSSSLELKMNALKECLQCYESLIKKTFDFVIAKKDLIQQEIGKEGSSMED